MLSFRSTIGAALAFSLATISVAAPLEARAATAQQVVANIGKLTQLSKNIQPCARRITAVNGPLVLTNQGPLADVVKGIDDLVTISTVNARQQSGTAPFPAGAQADAINNAYNQFSEAQTDLLTILTGKAGLFSTIPAIGAPVTSALRKDDNVITSTGFALADLIPSQSSNIQKQVAALDERIRAAEQAYGGLQLGPGGQ